MLIFSLSKISYEKYPIKFFVHSYEEAMYFNQYFTSVNQNII